MLAPDVARNVADVLHLQLSDRVLGVRNIADLVTGYLISLLSKNATREWPLQAQFQATAVEALQSGSRAAPVEHQ